MRSSWPDAFSEENRRWQRAFMKSSNPHRGYANAALSRTSRKWDSPRMTPRTPELLCNSIEKGPVPRDQTLFLHQGLTTLTTPLSGIPLGGSTYPCTSFPSLEWAWCCHQAQGRTDRGIIGCRDPVRGMRSATAHLKQALPGVFALETDTALPPSPHPKDTPLRGILNLGSTGERDY